MSTTSSPTSSTTSTATPTVRSAIAALGALTVAAAALLSGCGDDAADAAADGVLEIEMADFHYGDLPDEVPAGTRLAIENTSKAELHELVAVLLPDDDDRPVDEVLAAGIDALFVDGPPAAVLLAAPGGEQIAAVGDGTLTTPGRYLLLCAIPTGVDPETYLAAAAEGDGPPEVAGGAPHFTHGMVDELVVTP